GGRARHLLIAARTGIVVAAVAIGGDRLVVKAGPVRGDRLVVRLGLVTGHGLIVAALHVASGADRLRTRIATRVGRIIAGRPMAARVATNLEDVTPGRLDRAGRRGHQPKRAHSTYTTPGFHGTVSLA